jgi:hypothetical protein
MWRKSRTSTQCYSDFGKEITIMNKLLRFAESQENIDFVATRLGGSVAVFAGLLALAFLVAHFFK